MTYQMKKIPLSTLINQACDKIETAILALEEEDRRWELKGKQGFSTPIKNIIVERKRCQRDIKLMRDALASLNKTFI